jgi:hypothetical protein
MAKYSLLVNGTGFDGSAHVLTSQDVQKIQDFKEEAGYDGLDEMYSDLPELLENYDHYDTNYWVISTAMLHLDFISFFLMRTKKLYGM